MTSKAKGLILSVVLLVVALALLPIVISGVHSAQVASRTQVGSGLTVAGNATTITLTSGKGLFEGRLSDVTSVVASDGGTPVAFGYVVNTRVLTIHGLTATSPQDITVTYNYDNVSAYTGYTPIVKLIPLLALVGIIIFAIINGMMALKKNE